MAVGSTVNAAATHSSVSLLKRVAVTDVRRSWLIAANSSSEVFPPHERPTSIESSRELNVTLSL